MTSKFAGLKEMRERRAKLEQTVGETGSFSAPEPVVTPLPTTEPVRKVGRPPGKRSNPDYQQVTVLLHSGTYMETKKRLLDERKEVSQLLNELLEHWLKS